MGHPGRVVSMNAGYFVDKCASARLLSANGRHEPPVVWETRRCSHLLSPWRRRRWGGGSMPAGKPDPPSAHAAASSNCCAIIRTSAGESRVLTTYGYSVLGGGVPVRTPSEIFHSTYVRPPRWIRENCMEAGRIRGSFGSGGPCLSEPEFYLGHILIPSGPSKRSPTPRE